MWHKARAKVLRVGVAPDDADDLVQEAFARLEAYTRLHDVRSREGFVVHAAANIARDHMRRGRHAPFVANELAGELVADPTPATPDLMEMRQRLARLSDGIARLSPQTRAIFLAHRLDGLSYREIADREQLSVSAVEKRVARALAALMEWVHDDDE